MIDIEGVGVAAIVEVKVIEDESIAGHPARVDRTLVPDLTLRKVVDGSMTSTRLGNTLSQVKRKTRITILRVMGNMATSTEEMTGEATVESGNMVIEEMEEMIDAIEDRNRDGSL